jgi:hypothetical protein
LTVSHLQTANSSWRIPAVGLILLVIGLSLPAQETFPAFPANVTAAMDRDQMLFQSGITLPPLRPKLKDPNAPKNAMPAWGLWNNYDDRNEKGYNNDRR